MKRIILDNNKPPEFVGLWTVGEVLQMAQQLAVWVERLQVSPPTPPTPQKTVEIPDDTSPE